MTKSDQPIERLHEQMQELFARAKLPTSPAIASQILALIDRSDSTARQFAELIEADPALAGRLLKMANSARYAQRNPVTSIQRAITVLGNRQLRVIVLGFELVGHLDRLGNYPFDLSGFWQQSVLRACLARAVASEVVPALSEEAFLVGLLADSGVLPLVQVVGDDYARLCNEPLSPSAFYKRERRSFRFTHCDAAEVLARMWRLPEQIAAPLAGHHEPVHLNAKSSDQTKLAAAAYFAASIGFTVGATTMPSERDLLSYARRELKLDESKVARCFEAAGEAFARVAPLFKDRLPANQDVATLLAQANRHLLETACENEDRMRAIEEERDRILDEHLTLRTALGQYREQAARDPLTGLLNRRALLDALELLYGEGARTITLMFLDIDNFKTFNDCYGHHVGDAVLKLTSETVRMIAGEQGLASRYGGEEFIAVLSNLDEDEARAAAERLVEEVRVTGVAGIELDTVVTASVGVVWSPLEDAPGLSSMIGIADELMYAAKRSGKDHACYRSLEEPGRVVPLARRQGSDGGSLQARFIAPETFREVAERLDEQQQAQLDEELRKQPRRWSPCPCVINYFFPPSRRMLRSDGFVRTMSTGGIGLLTGRSLARGDLIEVELACDGKQLYVAGLVAFSRHIEGPIHEVGVQAIQSGQQPVLSDDPETALRDLDWAAQAMEAGRISRHVA
ncbi:MAG: HDOD domain-containing protein [Planctomycetota bacterium]